MPSIGTSLKTASTLALAIALAALGAAMGALAAEPQAFTVAQAPLYLTSPAPNVLLLLDNSNSFDERPDGVPIGSNNTASKSVIARAALRNVVSTYQGRINMGLMAFKLGGYVAAQVSPSIYDGSYEPNTYDPTYTDAKASANGWEAFPFSTWATTPYSGSYGAATMTCAAPFACPWGAFTPPGAFAGLTWVDTAFRGERRGKLLQYRNLGVATPWYQHPYDFIFYNLMQADYGVYSQLHCWSNQAVGMHTRAAGSPIDPGTWARYYCTGGKVGPNAGKFADGSVDAQGRHATPTSTNYAPWGYSTLTASALFPPTDSDNAQGFTSFGRNLIFFGNTLASIGLPAAPAYYQDGAPGYGSLAAPIQALDATQTAKLNGLLQCNIPATLGGGAAYTPPASAVACAGTGVVNTGATPSPGALQSALRYFQGAATAAENGTGVALATINTSGSGAGNLPNSCGNNYVIFVTDGMPTHDPNGVLYASPAAALSATVAAATALKAAGVSVFVIGFGNEIQQAGLDAIASAGGTTESFVATDSATLDAALAAVFSNVIAASASSASVATNSAQFSVGTALFQARFSSADWSGQLLKFQTDSATGAVAASADWDAGQAVGAQAWSSASAASDRRQIAMGARPGSGDPAGDSKGVPFAWPSAPATPTATEMFTWQSAALNKDQAGVADAKGSLRVNWLRGDHSNEGAAAPSFRRRPSSVLGDIVNSYPLFIGAPASQLATGNNYRAFKTNYAARREVVAAGANDGLMHLFDASSGKEVFAYAPSFGFAANPAASAGARLSQPMRQDYKTSHTYIVDGAPVSEDAYFGGAWHTVLVGSMAAGGQGYFALNATNTSNDASKPDPTLTEANAASVVLWEFGDKNTNSGTVSASGNPSGAVNGDPDLGYSFSKPLITLANNGKWVAVFGNGYNNTQADGSASSTGYAALFVVDVSNGHLIRKISVPVGSAAIPNGLGSPRGLDTNLDGVNDIVYAGDLYGNLWKFDLTNSDPSRWAVDLGGAPLFTINNVGAAGNRRPITGELRVTPHPAGGFVVLFGSGRYLANPGTDTPASYDALSLDALYSVWDSGVAVSGGRSWLTGQSLQYATAVNGSTYRQLTNNASTTCSYGNTPSTQPGCAMGCYVDLKDYPTAGYDGERFTFFPQLSAGMASFNTIIPSSNVCAAGGNSEQIIFNYLTCSASTFSPFDVNGDGLWGPGDLVPFNGGAPTPVGSKILTGITPPGTRVVNRVDGVTYVYNSSSKGNNPTQDRLRFNGIGGRVSWRPVNPNAKH